MFLGRKMMTFAATAMALSATLGTSNLFAAPAPQMAAVGQAATPQLPVPTPAPAAPVRNAVVAPAVGIDLQDEDRNEENTRTAVDERELECMTKVMLYEAGNEGRAGQLAVAHVVMNRVRSPRFPDSVCSVIYQRGQFSSIRSFSHARNARWNRAVALARDVLAGESESNVGAALYFHATRVQPAYVRSRTRVASIGNHIFYR